MLLNIYLGTTAVSWAITFISSAASIKKLERKGYRFVKPKKSFAERLASFIRTAFIGSIPVYNIINSIYSLYDLYKLYEYIEEKLLEAGYIYMPKDEHANTLPKMESSSFEKEQNNTDSIQKVNGEKKYGDMSIEEKIAYLEREKEILLRRKASISDESLFENLGQQGPVIKRTFNPKRK